MILNVAFLQYDIAWQSPQSNLAFIESKFDTNERIDLLILPETFSTGFGNQNTNLAETMDGETVRWMQTIAKTHSISIIGSLYIHDQSAVFNRCIHAAPCGKIEYYDKAHLFSLANESEAVQAGKKQTEFIINDFRIRPQICYDLRFPVWSRNTTDYDLLIYVANWPYKRIHAWNTLLKARAIENMSYVIGVNRIGTDPNGIQYSGQSQLIDPLGNILVAAHNDAGLLTHQLQKQTIINARQRFGFLEDRDHFTFL